MLHQIEDVLSGVESGRMSRRDAVMRLVAVVGAAAGMSRATATDAPRNSTFVAAGLNHVALRTSDVARSRDFYREHLGLQVIREGGGPCFLACGENNFLALFERESPGLDHYAFTVRDYAADDAERRVEAAGLQGYRQENRVYFKDVDGNTVQVSGEWDDYPGPRQETG